MYKKIKLLFVAEEMATNGAMMSMLALLKVLPSDRYDISLFLFKHNDMVAQMPKHIKVLQELYPYAVHRMCLKEGVIFCLKKFRLNLLVYRGMLSIQRFFHLNYRLWSFLPTINGEYDVACCYADGFVAPMIQHKVNAKKKVAWIHFLYSDWTQENFVYDALKNMDVCVPVSLEAGKDLEKILQVEVKWHLVHNITDAQRCLESADEVCEIPRKNGIWRIVSVGRVTPQKRFDIIPKVAQYLIEKGIKFEWLIIGDGEEKESIEKDIESNGLSTIIHLIGNRTNPMPLVKSADIVFIPSRSESWGMVVSEALCLGKAVVTSDIPVFKEQVIEGYNGLMRPAVPSIMAEAISMLLTDDSLRYRFEKNAANYPFTKETIVKEFNTMINDLLDIN